MCRRVGANFDKMDFKKENWFHMFEWTQKQENDFKKWLISYLFETKEARQELMSRPEKNKKHIEKVANYFICNYGWKIKNQK